MKSFILILVFFFWAVPPGRAQLKTYTFEEAEKQAKINPKPYFVFIHTSWCKYCQMMQKTTFKNPEIISLLNDQFYFIGFDAESKTTIVFHDKVFPFRASGYHDLAYELGRMDDQQLSFPVSCILNRNYEILFQVSCFLNSNELKTVLNETLRKQ
ncbi:thioredoxin family protein [Flavobacterium sp. CAU 1735]|uniref:thioredoxin family protein n=1 Tax=Flavobacterium sp. CAU 1735 TaxID=3140361 RepID=UPI003260A6D9